MGQFTTVTGQQIQVISAKDLNGKSPYVLCLAGPMDKGNTQLYLLSKEELYKGAFVDKDISEEIFNTPNYDSSYQDLIPGNWGGLPNMSKIGVNTPSEWIINFYRDPANTGRGTQVIKTVEYGIEMIRTSRDNIWSEWQIINSIPFGSIISGIFKDRVNNQLGWIPLNGVSYSKKMYPKLYEILKDKVVSDANTFTLPNIQDHYYLGTSNEDGAIGKLEPWKIPNKTDKIGVLAGAEEIIRLFRDNSHRPNSLFQIEREQDSTVPYLKSDIIELNQTGEPIVGDGSGLTNYLKLDFAEGFGADHVGNLLQPNTFIVSNFYIYAGYPQI